jgi:hypothetical protein
MAVLKKSNPKLYAKLKVQLNKNRRQKTNLESYRLNSIEFSKEDYERYILHKILKDSGKNRILNNQKRMLINFN